MKTKVKHFLFQMGGHAVEITSKEFEKKGEEIKNNDTLRERYRPIGNRLPYL